MHGPQENREFSPSKNFPHRELRFPLGSVEAKIIEEERWFLNISEIDDYYLYMQKVGSRLVVRNVMQQVELQLTLLWISLLVIGGGTVLSYLVSLFFVKSALKKLNSLNQMLESLDIDRLDQQLEITGHRHDEINRVMRKFNQALEKVNLQTRGLKDFVRNVAHELKTPMMGISSLISLARKSKEYEPALLDIKQEIKKMDTLLETLLLITQLEEKVQLSKEKLELTKDIRTLGEQLSSQYAEKNIKLTLNIPESLEMSVNEQGRQAILRNLLGNAFKFVGQEGNVEVSLSEKGLEVWNDGPSIAAEELELIWERFWQADAAHTDAKSFGLGLYLARLFAQKQGFELSCQSEKEKGVRFLLTF